MMQAHRRDCPGRPAHRPVDIVRVGVGEARPDGKRVAVGLDCVREIAQRDLRLADPLVGNRQIVVPAGKVGIGLGETFPDGNRGAI